MDRLNFSLPEFTRVIWASERAKQIWKPRIDRINTIWPAIERHTVITRLRSGALQSVEPDKLLDLQNWCLEHKQEHIIVAQEGVVDFYRNASKPFEAGKPWNYRVYIGNSSEQFLKAWNEGDNQAVAKLLGYPECCATAFQKYWHTDGWRDLTFAMTNFESKIVEGPATCNILLKHLGIRPVFHLPCSFDCKETAKIGRQIFEAIDDLGFHREAEWLYQMINWPVRWSSLHGVALITTPCFRIVTSSDALPALAVIDRHGDEYPDEGSSSNEFPFQMVQIIKLKTKDSWTDNGFTTLESMQAAHDLLLKTTEMILLTPGKILDLGCGNGRLLDKMCNKYDFLAPYGVEIDAERALKAQVHPKVIFETNISDVEAYKGDYELIFIAINRVCEIENDLAAYVLISKLKTYTRYLIVYSYQEWQDVRMDSVFSELFDLVAQKKADGLEARIYKPKP